MHVAPLAQSDANVRVAQNVEKRWTAAFVH